MGSAFSDDWNTFNGLNDFYGFYGFYYFYDLPLTAYRLLSRNSATFLAPSTFLARLEITDLISYLRITENPVNICCTLRLTPTDLYRSFSRQPEQY
jgi:hypothetical protein